MSSLLMFFLLLAAVVVSCLLCRWLASDRSFLKLLDVPNERSLHKVPIPRTGGVAILLTLTVGWFVIDLAEVSHLRAWPWFIVGYFSIAAISLADDHHQVPPLLRFGFHLSASLVPCVTGLWLDELQLPGLAIKLPAAIGMPLTVLYCAWMINLYNFMDGMDGFAGGMTVIGFTTLALLALIANNNVGFAMQAGLIAATVLGFLFTNFPPARLFLGDAGSAPLGFAAAFFSLWAAHAHVMPFWATVLLFSPFIMDASVTLARRALNDEKLSQAHRTHHYQRLVASGWSHKKTLFAEYLLMLGCALSAVAGARFLGPMNGWIVSICWFAAYTLMAFAVSRLERRYMRTPGNR